jgi:hypothetical protein
VYYPTTAKIKKILSSLLLLFIQKKASGRPRLLKVFQPEK